MTIGYGKELNYKEKEPPEQLGNSGKITLTPPFKTYTVTVEVIEISQEK